MNPVVTGLRSIAKKDSTPLRLHMFDHVLEVNWMARVVFRLYEKRGLRGLISLALVLRPVFRVLSARVAIVPENSQILVFHYSNERRALARVFRGRVGESGTISYQWSFSGAFHGALWLLASVFRFRKSWQAFRISFARARKRGFLVGARQAEFLILYAYFRHRFEKERVVGRDFASSTESNPEIIAPVLAARASGNVATYVNHGFLDQELGLFFHDRLVLDCEAVLERIEPNLTPGAAPRIEWDRPRSEGAKPRLPDFSRIRHVGIVGSITMSATEFSNVISECVTGFPSAMISVRPHPNTACTGGFYGAFTSHERVRIVTDRTTSSLVELASSWDFAIGGATSAHLELLRAGIPTVYMKMDDLDPDLYGFIDSVIVPKAGSVSEIPERLSETYGSSVWSARFARFSGGPGPLQPSP